ncbi:MAG: hypothetical protein HOW73_50605 [Polyangiaceae bacterium]|nr:hypothetical protein [Polyangiaceae bacterium]
MIDLKSQRWLSGSASLLALVLGGCAGSASPDAGSASSEPVASAPAPSASTPTPSISASAIASADAAPTAQPYARAIKETLEEVTKIRKLPVKSDVKSFSLGREALLEKTKKKMREEIPPGVVELQSEGLRGLGLIPVDYDLEAGFLRLISARVAGFYDPDEKAMYLIDDLSKAQEDETLPHELVHALQDQSFSIGWMLDYKPGKSDYLAAIQHLVEGDATLAGMLATYGSEFEIDPEAMRTAFFLSTAMSPVGAETPPLIVSSLISPYTDGFAFAKALHDEGGWAAVDAAFKRLPETTEQILHLEKYNKKEAALAIPTITTEALGPSYSIGLDETNGELGLRLMLEQWTALKPAMAAAAGWGGDRYVVAQTKDAQKSYAVALYTRMDKASDALEVAQVLKKQFGAACKERKDLGPVAWAHRGQDVVLVAGPYTKATAPTSAAGCKVADAWLKEILAAK